MYEYEKFTEYKNVIDMVSYSTLQLTFKKLPPVWFWYNIKAEYLQLSEKLQNTPPFHGCYSSTSTKTTSYKKIECRNRYENPVILH